MKYPMLSLGSPLFIVALLASAAAAEPPAAEIRLRPDLDTIDCAAISPDGKTVALGGRVNAVEVWDLVTGQRRAALKDLPGHVSSVTFSPDGKTVAIGSYKQVRLWQPSGDGAGLTLKGLESAIRLIRFTADGQFVTAVDSDDKALRWAATSGQVESRPSIRHADYVTASPDGNTLLTAGSSSLGLQIWMTDVPSLARRELRIKGWCKCVVFAPGGKTMYLGCGEGVQVLKVADGPSREIHNDHTKMVISVALSPDGKLVASGSEDKTAILWDLEARKERATLQGHTGPVEVLFSTDGQTLFTYSRAGTSVKAWDVATAKVRGTFPETPFAIRFVQMSPGGETLVAVLTAERGKKPLVCVWNIPGR
jgi:WD40 repeat protein